MYIYVYVAFGKYLGANQFFDVGTQQEHGWRLGARWACEWRPCSPAAFIALLLAFHILGMTATFQSHSW